MTSLWSSLLSLATCVIWLGCQRERAAEPPATAAPPSATAAAPTAPAVTRPVAAAAPDAAWPAESLFHSTTRWQTQAGDALALPALAGQPTVLAMVYTSCRASCPVMMADLKKLESALLPEERPGVRFVVVSFDAKGDTPASLRAFAKEQQVDEARWTFLHGEEAAVRELAALLDVRYVPLPQGGFDHANVITVLDGQGVIAHQQLGLNQPPEPTVARLRELGSRGPRAPAAADRPAPAPPNGNGP